MNISPGGWIPRHSVYSVRFSSKRWLYVVGPSAKKYNKDSFEIALSRETRAQAVFVICRHSHDHQ